MAGSAKPKKIRLYKFATEYNLSTNSLIEYLTEKGFAVKSKMSILSDEMISEINSKFKKEIEKAEKHYRKISEFQKLRNKNDDSADEDEQEQVQEEEPVVEEDVDKKEEVLEETHESESEIPEEPQSEPVVEEEPVVVEEAEAVIEEPTAVDEPDEDKVTEEVAEVVTEETEPETVEESAEVKTVDETAKAKEEVAEVKEETSVQEETPVKEESKTEEETHAFKTPLEIAMAKSHLKVLGKMDLPEKKRKRKKDRRKPADNKAKSAEPAVEPKKAIKKSQRQAEQNQVVEGEQNVRKKKLKAKRRDSDSGNFDQPVRGKKSRKSKKQNVDKRDVEEAIKRTMLGLDNVGSNSHERANVRKKKKQEKAEHLEQLAEEKEIEESKIKVTEFIAINELANLMNIPVNSVIQKCFELGMMVSINQRLDVETITLVADEFGVEVEFQEEYSSDVLEDVEDEEDTLEHRSPVVTIMGHVDHGKTSLLDLIRRTNVVAGESGGITQHIGAYQVTLDNGKSITFLDTPGHEAFTAMRARGASVTDIVVLVVAADDAVMPQTIEAINHSQAAGVPMIIAINKVDKAGANPDKIKQQLADRNILVEDWGGKYQVVEVSAKTQLNIDELLDKILLEAEMLDLKANPNRKARGAVIESQLDKGRGVTSTVLIEKGTLRIQDPFVAGVYQGRVRAMFDERNKPLKEVGPATPVLLLGFEGTPQAGDSFIVVDSEREAREIAIKRQQLKREQEHRQVHHITLDEVANQISMGGVKELPLIVKGDVDGSVEALSDSLMKLSNDEVIVNVIHKGVGGISEGDVILASASNAIIVGFHVRPHTNARKLAENEKVDIRLYNVIYDAINEVKSALEGLLSPIINEEVTATIEIRDTFKVPKIGTVAGCYVTDGKITRNTRIRLFRDGINIYEGELASLKRFKDDVKEVDAGYECGLNIHNFNNIKVGDVIEGYKLVETKKKLED